MQAGKLRHRVTIEYGLEIPDTFGEVDKTWTTLATVWGAVEPLSGREAIQAKQEGSDVTTRIRIRYRDDVNEMCRVKWGSRYYDINSVVSLNERDRELILNCTEATT